MKLSELLEEDRETLLRSLGGMSAQEGTELLQRETDRLLAAWNSGTDDPSRCVPRCRWRILWVRRASGRSGKPGSMRPEG